MTTQLFNSVPEEIWEAFKFNADRQRYLYYMDKLGKAKFLCVNYMDDETKICYSQSNVMLKMGAKLYLKRSDQCGFTFDKKTKKIKLWFGSSLQKMTKLNLLLKALKKEWLINEGFDGDWLTKTLLEKTIAGSITNPKQACRFILKQNKINLTIEQLRKYIKDGHRKFELLAIKDVIINLNEYIQQPNAYKIRDLIRQAKALGRKIDCAWSPTRLKELHTQWTADLMLLEIESFEDEKIEWPNVKLPNNFELLDSKRKVFIEGTLMHHCIYTNYWNLIRKKEYMALHVKDNEGNEATVGLRVNGKVHLDDVCAKYNRSPSLSIINMADRLVKNKEFIESVKTKKEKCTYTLTLRKKMC